MSVSAKYAAFFVSMFIGCALGEYFKVVLFPWYTTFNTDNIILGTLMALFGYYYGRKDTDR